MQFKLENTRDAGLIGFVSQLVEDGSLALVEEQLARKALSVGIDALSDSERKQFASHVIEPYLGDCEACGVTPGWDQVLMVYDTGLCASCFDKLEDLDNRGARTEWMPLVTPPLADEPQPETVASPGD